MADQSEQISRLRTEVASLRDELAALHQELRRARHHIDLTMRGQLRCPACHCRQIAHAPKVLDRGDGDFRKEMVLYQPSWWSKQVGGKLEVYACTRCGLVEWWADPSTLAPHPEYLHILDGGAGGGTGDPYR